MAIATKRGLKRKDLIQRIKVLEYALLILSNDKEIVN
tara:strand:+ start:64 stop:174 length:111 start_codon:yes stop_codon:yes gene_type:complete